MTEKEKMEFSPVGDSPGFGEVPGLKEDSCLKTMDDLFDEDDLFQDDLFVNDALVLVDNLREEVLAELATPPPEEVAATPAREEVVEESPAQEEVVKSPAQLEIVEAEGVVKTEVRYLQRQITANTKIIAMLMETNARLGRKLTHARAEKKSIARRKVFVPEKCRYCQKRKYSASRCDFKGVGNCCGYCDKVGRTCIKAATDGRHHR